MRTLSTAFRWSLEFVAAVGLLMLTAQSAQAQKASVTVENKSGQFVLIKLVGPTPKVVSLTNARTITLNVEPGTYCYLIRYGNAGGFRYSRGDSFTLTDSGQMRVTLSGIGTGNGTGVKKGRPMDSSSAEEFNRGG